MRASPVVRLAFVVVAACCGAILAPGKAPGQSVLGTVRGTVSDAHGPAAGARVSLAGTAFSAVTDSAGRFRMDFVPAGRYDVRAQATPGAAPGEVAGVRVTSGAAVRVAMRLGERREAAADPVPDGGPAARTVWSGDQLSALPIDDSRQGLALGQGVVGRGVDPGVAALPSLTIRGSGPDQTSAFVDGAPARFETLGAMGLDLPADAIGEASVATGVLPASVADARGATIAYVTRAGGPRFASGLRASTDGPFSRDATVGFNRFDAFAGGPVPGVARLTWFASGSLIGQASAYRGAGADSVPTFALAGIDTVVSNPVNGDTVKVAVPRFAQAGGRCGQLGGDSSALGRQIRSNYGLACSGLRLNLDWSTSRRAQAKLQYSYGAGSSVSVTGLVSDFQRRTNPGQDLADNLLYAGTRAASALAVVNWTHRLVAPLGGALTLSANLSLASDATQTGPLDLASEAATRAPALGIEMSRLRFSGLDGLPLPLTDAVIRQVRSGTFRPPLYGRLDLAATQTFRFNPYGMSGAFPTDGLGGEVTAASETRVTARVGAEWRAAPGLALEGGADLSRTDLSYYDATLLQSFAPDAFTAQPRRTGAFVLGRAERAGLTLEAGVRADRYATGAAFPTIPGRLFSSAAWSASTDTATDARIARVLAPARSQSFLTPHVRLAVRAGRGTSAWAAFSQQVEVPPYEVLFTNVNTDLAWSAGGTAFGRDVSYVKSSLVEGGVRHVFPSRISLEASVFEKTGAQPYMFAAQQIYDPAIGGDPSQPNESVVALAPTPSSRALGGELRATGGAGRAIGWSASYSLVQRHVELGGSVLPAPAGVPDHTTHALAATLVARAPDDLDSGSALGRALRGASAVLVGRATSGEPYTPLSNSGVGEIAPFSGIDASPGAAAPVDLPWTWTIDLRIAKAVEIGGVRWTAYAEARNLLNASNLVAAFAETGTDHNTLFQAQQTAPQVSPLIADAGALWFTRQVVVNGVAQTQTGVDLSDCSRYPVRIGGAGGVPDCVALRQVEARWGNGDGFYDTGEMARALGAWYDAVHGAWAFHGPARTARVGIRIEF